ncbi:MAG: hypothetical protein V3W41_06245 [Planctomycetota bacterium]
MGKWTDKLKADPTPWLLEKACPSIRFRLFAEIQRRPSDDPDLMGARQEVYSYKPPHTIAAARSDDGTWFNSLMGFEAMNLQRKRGPGLVWQYLALVEYGWGQDHPIIWSTSELLQGLLWEDPSIDLCELNGYLGGDPAVQAFLRKRLSRIAMALLCRSGFENDAGVKRKSDELFAELDSFYRGDIESKIYVGEHIREKETDEGTIEEVCSVFPSDQPVPEYMLLLQLAHNTNLRQREGGQELIDRLVDFLFSQKPAEHEVTQVGGKTFEKYTRFSIRTMEQKDYEEQKLVGQLLQDLEILARCGALTRVPKAVAFLDWLIGLQDEEGVVRADDFIEKTVNRLDYVYFPLEDNWRGKHKKFTDVTFRLFLILSLLDQSEAS